jgi:predicted nucleic acid-binding protein
MTDNRLRFQFSDRTVLLEGPEAEVAARIYRRLRAESETGGLSETELAAWDAAVAEYEGRSQAPKSRTPAGGRRY